MKIQIDAAAIENSNEGPPNSKNETAYDLVTPFLGIYLKKFKTLIQKNVCTPMLVAALFTTDKTWKQPKCSSVEERIKKNQTVVHINNRILFSNKKNEILAIVTA